jgi:general stress protein 26
MVLEPRISTWPQGSDEVAERTEQIKRLAELIKDVRIAMLTTCRSDGRLVSRPLGTQEVEFDGDLWFATAADSAKVAEIAGNPYVNVSYASTSANTFVSVSGRAEVLDDRAKVEEIWSPSMQLFFPGGKDDPNLRLVRVQADTAEYWDGPGMLLGKALHLMLTAVTDDPAPLSENELIDLR